MLRLWLLFFCLFRRRLVVVPELLKVYFWNIFSFLEILIDNTVLSIERIKPSTRKKLSLPGLWPQYLLPRWWAPAQSPGDPCNRQLSWPIVRLPGLWPQYLLPRWWAPAHSPGDPYSRQLSSPSCPHCPPRIISIIYPNWSMMQCCVDSEPGHFGRSRFERPAQAPAQVKKKKILKVILFLYSNIEIKLKN